jgi:hypothetical protein
MLCKDRSGKNTGIQESFYRTKLMREAGALVCGLMLYAGGGGDDRS